jgi:hypothetical protein
MYSFTHGMSRFLKKTFGSSRSQRGRRTTNCGSLTRRSRFERLEDRSVLSATFGSAFALGGPEGERVYDLKLDGAGNTYVTGYYMGTADFDQGRVHLGDADILTSKGGTDGFVAKYAPDNSLLWVRALGGDAVPEQDINSIITEAGRSLAVDHQGNVFVTGEFWGHGQFGGTELVSAGSADGFLAKLNADGTFAWAKNWGTSGGEAVRGVDVDAQGNVYVINNSTNDSVQKFNTAGQSLWIKSIPNNVTDIAVNPAGAVSVVGSFTGKVDFDPGPKTKYVTAGTNSAAYVLNLDTNGNFRWVTPFMGSGTAHSPTVEVDGSGNVYAAGKYYGSIDFDPTWRVSTLSSGSAGGSYITKLSSSGSLVWARGLVGGSVGGVYGLAVDATGNVYATGTFYSSIDLNPGSGSVIRTTSGATDGDIFVVKLSSSGNYVWGETFGGAGLDIGYGLAIDNDGDVVLGGTFGDLVDFDPNPLTEYLLAAAGQREAFILRLNQS